MLKKVLVILLLCSNLVFANDPENTTASTEPKYKISDMDMKIFIRQLNNIEQCIYPDLGKHNYKEIYSKWSVAETLTIQYFEHQILKELLGEKHFNMMQTDDSSMNYFNLLHTKLNHQKANVDKELCEDFKLTYQDVYTRVQNTLPKVYK
ncbi:DUF5358 family protein [Mannheimia granulomatis]|uniref:DUF5358 family protein n=1 Tax=Mannheimia granulomatis TaxID=85402 RepID=UPI00047AC689|nr:DUF5358 family protein [Mannheimia granulomatis]QLB18763.1 hypothetical protein A6B41_04520 [Mannheimia granulomatis]